MKIGKSRGGVDRVDIGRRVDRKKAVAESTESTSSEASIDAAAAAAPHNTMSKTGRAAKAKLV